MSAQPHEVEAPGERSRLLALRDMYQDFADHWARKVDSGIETAELAGDIATARKNLKNHLNSVAECNRRLAALENSR